MDEIERLEEINAKLISALQVSLAMLLDLRLLSYKGNLFIRETEALLKEAKEKQL